MCYVVYNHLEERKIAKEDITIYKVLTRDLKGPFTGFQYELNRVYKEPIVIKFHQFNRWEPREETHIEQGLHCLAHPYPEDVFALVLGFTSIFNRRITWDLFIGFIPKGTVYFQHGNEIVTSSYILTNKYDKVLEKVWI